MAFRDARNIDASQSAFNDVGHDQNNTISQTNNIFQVILPKVSASELRDVLDAITVSQIRTVSQWPASVSQGRVEPSVSSDIAMHLIVQIVSLLMNPNSQSSSLKLELESLQRVLTLSVFAIRAYEFTPLGQRLAIIFNQEIQQSCLVLRRLLDIINNYRHGLKSTRISYWWYPAQSIDLEIEELTALRTELSSHRETLCNCIVALHS